MIKLDCYAIHADELEQVDEIAVNGVHFVPRTRLDGAKEILCDYLEDARAMIRERDELIASMRKIIDLSANVPATISSVELIDNRIARLQRLDE